MRFSRKITTPPQVLELQVLTPEQLHARVAAVAPKGVRDGGFEVLKSHICIMTVQQQFRSSSNGAQKEVG